MKQKLFTLLLAFIAAISFAHAKDIASGSFKNGGTWKITQDGELYIDAATVPDYKLSGSKSTAPWSDYASSVYTVRFSSKVNTIGEYAFAYLCWLKSVKFDSRSNYNVEIKTYAFQNCYSLYDFDFSYVAVIRQYAFSRCNLQKIYLPKVTRIEDFAFELNAGLMRDVYTRAKDVYSWSIWIANTSKVNMGTLAFAFSHEYVTAVTQGGNFNGLYYPLYVQADGTIAQQKMPINLYNMAYSVVVPFSVHASYESDWQTMLHSGVALSAAGGAFFSAKESVGKRPYWLYDTGTLFINTLSQDMPDYTSASAAPWHSLRSEIHELMIKTHAIGAYAFTDIHATMFRLEAGLEEIHDHAFENAFTTASLSLDLTGVKSIGQYAFAGCTSLYDIRIPNVQTIGTAAFKDAKQVKRIYFGNEIPTIESKAFANIELLMYVYAFETCPNTKSDAFDGVKQSTVELHIPASVADTYESSAAWKGFNIKKIVDFPVKGSGWTLSSEGALKITSNVSNYTSATQQPWYNYREYIRDIIVDNGVTTIGDYAFAFAATRESKIVNVSIPRTCKTIGKSAFRNNDQMVNIYLTDVESIGEYAFSGCAKVTDFSFGSKLQSVGNYALQGCVNLDMAEISALNPPTATANAFSGIKTAVSSAPGRNNAPAADNTMPLLTVPEAALTKYLTATGWKNFRYETGSEHGTINKSGQFGDGYWILYSDGTMVASSEGEVSEWDVTSFDSYKSQIKTLEVVGTMTSLDKYFAHCPNLETVVLTNSITELRGTFADCPKLKSINADNLQQLSYNYFYDKTPSYEMGAFEGCTSLTEIDLPSAKYIWDYSFRNCTSLKKATFANVITVNNEAFSGCSALESINLGNANTLAQGVFSGCTKLKEVWANPYVIASRAFEGCTALTTLHLGSRLEGVYPAFYSTQLATIYISAPSPADCLNWNPDGKGFDELTRSNIKVYVPQEYVNMYKNADQWKDMQILTDPSYTDYVFPAGGTLGANGTWRLGTDGKLTIDCQGEMVDMSTEYDSFREYPYYAYRAYITSVEFTPTTTAVSATAVHDAPSLTTITLGENITSIGNYAFYYVSKTLKDVYCYAANPPSFDGTSAFWWYYVTGATLHVLKTSGVKAKYEADEYWSKFNIVADLTPQGYVEYTVRFEDWDGTVLREEQVEQGGDANEPMHPTREGYEFIGWDNVFTNVQSDLVVTAQYKEAMGIWDVQVEKVQCTKILIDGQLFIIRPDGAIFNAQGARVK